MILLFNKDGSIRKALLNEYIQQGSDKVNSVLCYVYGLNNQDIVYSLIATLPDGTQIPLMSVPTNFYWEGVIYTGVKFILDSSITQLTGTLTFNLSAYNGVETLITYRFQVLVNEGLVNWDTAITNAEYNNLLAQLHNFTEYIVINGGLIHIIETEQSEIYIDRPYIHEQKVFQNGIDITEKYENGTIFFARNNDRNVYDSYILKRNVLVPLPKQQYELATTHDFDLTQEELTALKENSETLITCGNETRLFKKGVDTIYTIVPKDNEKSAYLLIYQYDGKWDKVSSGEIDEEKVREIIEDYIQTEIIPLINRPKGIMGLDANAQALLENLPQLDINHLPDGYEKDVPNGICGLDLSGKVELVKIPPLDTRHLPRGYEKDQANGIAGLDRNGKVLASQIPNGFDNINAILDFETRTELPLIVENVYVALQIDNGDHTYSYDLYKAENLEWVYKGKLTREDLLLYNNELYRVLLDENDSTTEPYLMDIVKSVGVDDYTILRNKPQINGNDLSGNKTSEQLGIIYKLTISASVSKDGITIPDITYQNVIDFATALQNGKSCFVDYNHEILTIQATDFNRVGIKILYRDYILNYYIDTSGGGGFAELKVEILDLKDYAKLTNKPQINSVELSGNKTLADLGINIPTKTSDLLNDSGFIDDTYHDSTKQDVIASYLATITKDTANQTITITDNNGNSTSFEYGSGSGGTSDCDNLINKPKINNKRQQQKTSSTHL